MKINGYIKVFLCDQENSSIINSRGIAANIRTLVVVVDIL